MASSTVPPPRGQNTTIWIIGDSYVRRGAQRAAESTGGNLGLNAYIRWFGWGGLRWRRLLPFFLHCLRGRAAPDVLLIHCGGNDLGETSSVQLVNWMKEDLHQLHHWHPDMMIMFSSLCQGCQWKAGANPINTTSLHFSIQFGVDLKYPVVHLYVFRLKPEKTSQFCCWFTSEFPVSSIFKTD
ncbi:hypothetical protein D5F01_LYC06713 [Larimichthys crocea]|uniref:SGNH hydrolase-type esterase domain-containing protein n=1 Tax=Larimichthys crocea TaxID=215358 RepID=A0A6G0IR21_LARCR|nr:hypothetical protein D5F01_LYC06713 [Larimichthys crocea]